MTKRTGNVFVVFERYRRNLVYRYLEFHTPQIPMAGQGVPAGDAPGAFGNTVDEYQQRWERGWAAGLRPGDKFDAKQSSPALVNLLSQGHVSLLGAKVYVPGCGRGYDCVAFHKAGAKTVVGLEIADSAINPAREYIQSQLGDSIGDACQVVKGDFFKEPSTSYDVGYDYTFLCAMRPDMREDWARAWHKHLRPGGKLITLIFPTDPSVADNPPWVITPDLCKSLLFPLGFELGLLEKVPENLSHPGRGGMEYMAVWTRK